jgi:hypothetical protein
MHSWAQFRQEHERAEKAFKILEDDTR